MGFTLSNDAASRPRQTRRSRRSTPLIASAAAVGALAAVLLSDAAPTHISGVDAVYRGALVALVALAASRAHRWTLVWASAITVLAAGGWAAVPSGLALVASVGLFLLHRHDRGVRAAIGATVGVVALLLRWPSPSRSTAVVAVIAVVPVLISGVRRMHRRNRKYVWAGLAGAGAFATIGLMVAGAFAATAAPAVTAGIAAANDAIDSIDSESSAQSIERFNDAAEQFQTAYDAAGAWWLAPARALPIVGPHLRLARNTARSGSEISTVAADVATSASDDALRAPNGAINLQKLAALRAPADRARSSLAVVQQRLDRDRSPWIVAPVERRVNDVDSRVTGARRAAELAAVAAERGPELLGGNGPRRYV
ncbi:MAG: hypothetical protein ACKOYM_09890, partial [Actinomycetes bacterium]